MKIVDIIFHTINLIMLHKWMIQKRLPKSSFVGNKAKGWISKRVFQESKARQNARKTNISYPLIRTRTSAYQEVRNVCFSESLACFAFLKHPFWDSPFCLITDGFSKSLTDKTDLTMIPCNFQHSYTCSVLSNIKKTDLDLRLKVLHKKVTTNFLFLFKQKMFYGYKYHQKLD